MLDVTDSDWDKGLFIIEGVVGAGASVAG